jgi:hypothetical protein
MLLAVADTLAIPERLVTAVELDNTALAPAAGAAKVTVTPFTGFPIESFTVACRVLGNAAPGEADCGVPPVAVILAYVAGVLVSGKFAENTPPGPKFATTVATTV